MSSVTNNNLKGWRLLATPFVFSLLLLLAPLLLMLTMSFWTQDYLTLDRTFTLNNYEEALTQPVYQMLFKRSLFISLSVSDLTILIAFVNLLEPVCNDATDFFAITYSFGQAICLECFYGR